MVETLPLSSIGELREPYVSSAFSAASAFAGEQLNAHGRVSLAVRSLLGHFSLPVIDTNVLGFIM